MTTSDRKEIKGITLPIIYSFVIGTVSVCTSVIGTGFWVINTVKENSRDIVVMKQDIKDNSRDITALQLFRERVEIYFDKPKPTRPAIGQRNN
jgi:hypothetical protein